MKIIYLIWSRASMYGESDYLQAIYDNEKEAQKHIDDNQGYSLEIEESILFKTYKESEREV